MATGSRDVTAQGELTGRYGQIEKKRRRILGDQDSLFFHRTQFFLT